MATIKEILEKANIKMSSVQRIAFGQVIRKKFKNKGNEPLPQKEETHIFMVSDYPESFEEYVIEIANAFCLSQQKKQQAPKPKQAPSKPYKTAEEIYPEKFSSKAKEPEIVYSTEKKKRPRINRTQE